MTIVPSLGTAFRRIRPTPRKAEPRDKEVTSFESPDTAMSGFFGFSFM